MTLPRWTLPKTASRLALGFLVAALMAAWAGESMARRRMSGRYQDALRTARQLELQFADVQIERDRLARVAETERDRSDQLAATLAAKDEQLQSVISRLGQEETLIEDLQQQLVAMQTQLDRMQGELTAGLDAKSKTRKTASRQNPVELERVIVSDASSESLLQGHVVSVHPEWQFVVIDLGWDTVNIGDLVSIYRGSQLIGRARVERVQEQVSAASLLADSVQGQVQIDDVVRVL